ncbi:MAG: hypothetical protein AAFV53_36900, partial [Myxococcota bacterium]
MKKALILSGVLLAVGCDGPSTSEDPSTEDSAVGGDDSGDVIGGDDSGEPVDVDYSAFPVTELRPRYGVLEGGQNVFI